MSRVRARQRALSISTLRLALSGGLIALAFSACSEPPDRERQQAEGAVQAARAAGADVYAPAELQDAEASLRKYDEAVAQRDYRQALNNALEARDLAYEAVKQAGNKKAELRSQADRLLAELDTLVDMAGARLVGAGRLTGAAAARVRASRDAGRRVLQETRSQAARQDDPAAVERISRAVEVLRRDLDGSESAASKRRK